MRTKSIAFKVAGVSANTNSFGLRGHILVSKTGICVELGLNSLNSVPKGTVVKVPVCREDLRSEQSIGYAVAHKLHGEIPYCRRRLPKHLMKGIW